MAIRKNQYLKNKQTTLSKRNLRGRIPNPKNTKKRYSNQSPMHQKSNQLTTQCLRRELTLELTKNENLQPYQ